jgi:hypothetical protein
MSGNNNTCEAIQGAAKYVAVGKNIWMYPPDENGTIIDRKGSDEAAKKAAIKWQEKENKAVLKNQQPQKARQ